jgi:hypothetical protein
MSLLGNALNWLTPALQTTDGIAVTYRQASGDTAPLVAVRGETTFREEANEERGARIVRSADFLLSPAEFVAAFGPGAVPEDGDQIETASTVYRVSSFNGEPVFRIDAAGTLLRVHTQEYSLLEVC